MQITSKENSLFNWVGGVVILVILFSIPIIFIMGLTWVSVKVSPWLLPVTSWILLISLFILTPLAFFKKSRGFSANGFLVFSYLIGTVLWVSSLLSTYAIWGTMGVVIGLLVLGIGVVPVSILATLLHADWMNFSNIIFLVAVTYGFRLLSFWLSRKVIVDNFSSF